MFSDLTLEQLLVLQRALLEAKFAAKPRDPALQGSPIVAGLASGVVQEIRERYSRAGDDARARQWAEWSRWSRRALEQAIVLEHLQGSESWHRMTDSSRRVYVKALIAPFEASESEITELINAID